MPRLIPAETEERLELAELVEMLETGDFDSQDEDNFASWGLQLRKLANDRDFLADMMIAELKQRCDGRPRQSVQRPGVGCCTPARPGHHAANSACAESGRTPFGRILF